MLNRFAFISYSVSNLEQSIVFYRDLIGLKLLISNDLWAEFNVDGQRLAIHKTKDDKTLDVNTGTTVYFEANPIENIVEALKLKGIKFHGEIATYPYGKLIIFHDLDMNSLGLYEPPKK
jgi:predicted enzyme related to lactoylglutathione lyase